MRYTKLFSSIIHSSIWQEDKNTKLLWITMLAMSDWHGEVNGSVIGLAKAAGIEPDDCVESLEKLKSPDKWSRSQEFDGRRIEEIDGGWVILNYTKYRELLSEEQRKERNRERQRRYREKKKVTQDVTHHNGKSRHLDLDTDLDKDIKKKKETKKKQNYPPEFEKFWVLYPKKNNKKEAYTQWKKAKPDTEVVCEKLYYQILAKDKCRAAGQFVADFPDPHRYIRGHRWNDAPDELKVKNKPAYKIKYTQRSEDE
jgi:hypothetical protein